MPGAKASGHKAAHGTAVAGVLLDRYGGPVPGVAPACRAVGVPVFAEGRRTSQLDLARAIGAGAENISGRLGGAAEAEDVQGRAMRSCRDQGVLIVAAAGNDGSQCHQVPAAPEWAPARGLYDQRRICCGCLERERRRPAPHRDWRAHP
ncbi:S8 family serine peptidase [Nonomuraea angiospora]|uniref:S8 family serine peptidase n=1 Tax=Nonomuraea angiospora TaxID=46172 RepID=UPI00378F29C9